MDDFEKVLSRLSKTRRNMVKILHDKGRMRILEFNNAVWGNDKVRDDGVIRKEISRCNTDLKNYGYNLVIDYSLKEDEDYVELMNS